MNKTDDFITQQDVHMFQESLNHFFMGIHYYCYDSIFPNHRLDTREDGLWNLFQDPSKSKLAHEFLLYQENLVFFMHHLLFWSGFHYAQQGKTDLQSYYQNLQFQSTLIHSPGYQALQKKLKKLFIALKAQCTKKELVQILEKGKQNKYTHPDFKKMMFHKGYLFYHYFQEVYESPSPLFKNLSLESLLEILPY